MTFEIDCCCGNPQCHQEVILRKGLVWLLQSDGSYKKRRDHFYIDMCEHRDEPTGNVEIMLPAAAARELMWWMIGAYFPVVCTLVDKAGTLWFHLKRLRQAVHHRIVK